MEKTIELEVRSLLPGIESDQTLVFKDWNQHCKTDAECRKHI